jgi:hypothetical protein
LTAFVRSGHRRHLRCSTCRCSHPRRIAKFGAGEGRRGTTRHGIYRWLPQHRPNSPACSRVVVGAWALRLRLTRPPPKLAKVARTPRREGRVYAKCIAEEAAEASWVRAASGGVLQEVQPLAFTGRDCRRRRPRPRAAASTADELFERGGCGDWGTSLVAMAAASTLQGWVAGRRQRQGWRWWVRAAVGIWGLC